MTKLPAPLALALAALVITAAICDLRTRRIPNTLVVTGAIAGLALNLWQLGGLALMQSLAGLFFGLLIFLPIFALGGMGGGDVKLMGAIGALVGLWNFRAVFVFIAISGGIMALAMLWYKGELRTAFKNIGFILNELAHGRAPHKKRPDLTIDSKRSIKLPYAVPMAVGCLVFLSL